MKESNDAKHPPATHEENLVDSRGITGFGISLGLLIVITGVLMWATFRYFDVREAGAEPPPSRLTKTPEQKLPPEPRLQGLPGHEVEPLEEMKNLRANDQAILSSYGWVDQKAGVTRIPIERAMTLIVERGLPVGEKPEIGIGETGNRGNGEARTPKGGE